MAISLNVSDGKQEFYVNGDPNRAIWINTNDTGIITRAKREVKKLEALQEEVMLAEQTLDEDSYIDMLEKSEDVAKKTINMIFAADVADTVFGLLSPFAIVKIENGRRITYMESFFDSIMPYIEKGIDGAVKEIKASKQRMSKYTNKYARNRGNT